MRLTVFSAMNRVAVARGLAYGSLALSPVPVVGLVAYARLVPKPLDITVQYAVSIAMLASFGCAPVAAVLATWLGQGTSVRWLGAVALGLWLLVFAFLVYTSVR
jgi:hypothetical protein